jgi:hypothetical protein
MFFWRPHCHNTLLFISIDWKFILKSDSGIMMESNNERNSKSNDASSPSSLRTAVSALPSRGWLIASFLAIPPAVGFYVLMRTLTEQAEPLFVVFYWIASVYVLVRKAHDLHQVYKRTCILMGLEVLGILMAAILA